MFWPFTRFREYEAVYICNVPVFVFSNWAQHEHAVITPVTHISVQAEQVGWIDTEVLLYLAENCRWDQGIKRYMSQMSRLIFLILQVTDACSADGRCQPLREEPAVGGCGFVVRGESLFWNQGSYTRWITQRMEWNGLKMNYVLSIFTRQAALLISPRRMKKHLNLRPNLRRFDKKKDIWLKHVSEWTLCRASRWGYHTPVPPRVLPGSHQPCDMEREELWEGNQSGQFFVFYFYFYLIFTTCSVNYSSSTPSRSSLTCWFSLIKFSQQGGCWVLYQDLLTGPLRKRVCRAPVLISWQLLLTGAVSAAGCRAAWRSCSLLLQQENDISHVPAHSYVENHQGGHETVNRKLHLVLQARWVGGERVHGCDTVIRRSSPGHWGTLRRSSRCRALPLLVTRLIDFSRQDNPSLIRMLKNRDVFNSDELWKGLKFKNPTTAVMSLYYRF